MQRKIERLEAQVSHLFQLVQTQGEILNNLTEALRMQQQQ